MGFGNRQFAKENERRTRAAVKEAVSTQALSIATKYALAPAEVEPVVKRHGAELAARLAFVAVEAARPIGMVSDFYACVAKPLDVSSCLLRVKKALAILENGDRDR